MISVLNDGARSSPAKVKPGTASDRTQATANRVMKGLAGNVGGTAGTPGEGFNPSVDARRIAGKRKERDAASSVSHSSRGGLIQANGWTPSRRRMSSCPLVLYCWK